MLHTFTTLEFLLFIFAVAVIYYVLPFRYSIRNVFLLAASYFFYISAVPKYFYFLILSTAISYFGALLVDRVKNQTARKIVHVLAVVLNLGMLVVLKYFNFFMDTAAALTGASGLPALSVALPLGISYYTFQSLGYQIDVYNRKLPAEKNPITYALFVSFFPSVIMGPIGRAREMLPQFKEKRALKAINIQSGVQRFLLGAFKKLVVAETLLYYINRVYMAPESYSGFVVLFCIFMYSIAIYADFSGFSDMAIGVGRLLGFEMRENFAAPYFATNMSGFWKRWHMSLTSWFQDYVFTPLVWSRWFDKLFFRKKLDAKNPHIFANILIVFLLSGLWHGAGWNFVVWGALHGLFRIAEELIHRWRKKPKPLNSRALDALRTFAKRALVFLIASFTFVFFSTPTLAKAGALLRGATTNMGALSSIWELFANHYHVLYTIPDWFVQATIFALLACLIMLFLFDNKINRTPASAPQRENPLMHMRRLPRWLSYYFILCAILALGQFGSSSFIYFDF